ncbi:MAG: hypothetical protein ACHP7J_06125 [Terriglobales bacterium]
MIVRPKQEPLGVAMTVAGKPARPQRPQYHRNGAPPTPGYRKNHPTLKAPAIPAALPVRATQGVNQNELGSYLKALKGG